jgi:hypothetical protein
MSLRRKPPEQEGTYPLPEAQLEALMQIDVHYPTAASGGRCWKRLATMAEASQALDAEEPDGDPAVCGRLPIGERSSTRSSISLFSPSRRGRRGNRAACRPTGTRAAQALMLATRAWRSSPAGLRLHRRCSETCRAGVAPPHGAQFRRAPRDDRFDVVQTLVARIG